MNISIYAILAIDDENQENIYIGSTNNFNKRKSAHKSKCNNPNDKEYKKPLYEFIRHNGGWDNFIMDELINKKVNTKQELLELERAYIELMGATLNKQIPWKLKELGKEEYHKQYYEENKDKISEYQKEHNKEYYRENKEKILEYKSEKITCKICNCQFRRDKKTKHNRSKKHLNNAQNQEETNI